VHRFVIKRFYLISCVKRYCPISCVKRFYLISCVKRFYLISCVKRSCLISCVKRFCLISCAKCWSNFVIRIYTVRTQEFKFCQLQIAQAEGRKVTLSVANSNLSDLSLKEYYELMSTDSKIHDIYNDTTIRFASVLQPAGGGVIPQDQ